MDEFDLIRRYFRDLTPSRRDVHLGIGDDAALLKVPAGHELVVTTDTLVAGRHFPDDTQPFDIGWKSLAVNLSDLAAMGAEPRWFTLALTLRLSDPFWLESFGAGLRAMAEEAKIGLVGGDTTQGPLSITITAMGTVPEGKGMRRDGARPGDLVCVTGTLGDGALALQMLNTPPPPRSARRKNPPLDAEAQREARERLLLRLHRPVPRVSAGVALRGIAHAVIDLSDGLAGDLQHICLASGVGAEIHADRLPMSPEFERLASRDQRLLLQAAGGDDYELCICLPPEQLETARRKVGVPLTVVGQLTQAPGVRFLDAQGGVIALEPHGYLNFP